MNENINKEALTGPRLTNQSLEEHFLSLESEGQKDKNKSNPKNNTGKIPHLQVINDKVQIDSRDPKQVKWFKDFKR